MNSRKSCFSFAGCVVVLVLAGCSDKNVEGGDNGGQHSGGASSSGGTTATTGGAVTSGGTASQTSSGGTSPSSGGAGAQSSGGMGTGGTSATGGDANGGAGTSGSGSSSNGGSSGSASSGGSSGNGNGGNANGGRTSTGGSGNGGTGNRGGGSATGGSATGGNATGGLTSTACSFPSGWNPGSPTYTTYTLPNPQTACGYNGSNNQIKNIPNPGNFAAIPGNSSSDFNTSNRCGACVQIGNAIITIVDECPFQGNQPCQNNPSGHLDLSQAAASSAGVKGDPAVRNQAAWKFVPCPAKGNVMVRLKNGNNNEFFIENEILPIQAVSCDGQTGSRTSYGAWHFGQDVNGKACTVTDISNRTINITVGTSQGQDVDSGVQFPKCN